MLQKKVMKLLKYCGHYQSHGFMMDERNTDIEFNISMPEEEKIRNNIKKLQVILLTGEAGDGKTRIVRNTRNILEQNKFTMICEDFSALSEEEKKNLINKLSEILEGKLDDKIIVLANVGAFTQAVIRYNASLMDKLTSDTEKVYVCNFENRNLAEDEYVFNEIVEGFLLGDKPEEEITQCSHKDCPCYEQCIYKTNMKKILSGPGTEAIRTICNTIYLTGGHITFRELLSLLAYMVTFGLDCTELQEYYRQDKDLEQLKYYNVFENSDDILLDKISCMDPAMKRGKCPEYITTKKAYRKYRRQQFFEPGVDKYAMLNVDYLVEFNQVLRYMDKPPYHYDTIQDNNVILQKLKKGINKMSNQGKGDRGLIITDTPFILGNQIRTEFMLMQDMNMIWHRYDMQMGAKTMDLKKEWNKFYLSYVIKEDRTLISLLIDYSQFRYLMACSEDYYMNRNELTVEEYAVNTFYRKILQKKEQAYDSIVIRFNDKTDQLCDFSLTVHESEDFFTGEKNRSVRIRRED